jgi:hypothetical protein
MYFALGTGNSGVLQQKYIKEMQIQVENGSLPFNILLEMLLISWLVVVGEV